jgi:hypothetical protein
MPGARRFHLRALNRRRFAWLAALAAGRIRGLGTSHRPVPPCQNVRASIRRAIWSAISRISRCSAASRDESVAKY